MIEQLSRKSLVATAAGLMAALGVGGAAIAQSGPSGSAGQAGNTPAGEVRETPGQEAPESTAPENSATDPDNVQDENGKDDATEASERGSKEEDSSREIVNDDGPGGHADEPGNPNADHENQGAE